ncbi:MAG: phosphoribosyl-AMP cyclohydrolase [Hyphomicrobiaceae bacterium]
MTSDSNATSASKSLSTPPTAQEDIEESLFFQPRFSSDGLIPVIVTDHATNAVLMFAWMNECALCRTLSTNQVHFWSRSRKRLWRKGEASGNFLSVEEIRTDCDQDVIWVRASVAGPGVACHTGRSTCFYRRIEKLTSASGPRALGAQLVFDLPRLK